MKEHRANMYVVVAVVGTCVCALVTSVCSTHSQCVHRVGLADGNCGDGCQRILHH